MAKWFVVAALLTSGAVLGAGWVFMARHAGGPLGCIPCAALLLGGPIVVLVLLGGALLAPSREPIAAPPEDPEASAVRLLDALLAQAAVVPAPAASAPEAELLTALQRGGFLLDFLTEDISRYSDADVGATTRDIQRVCGGALRELVGLESILPGQENDVITIDGDYDPAALRLTGNARNGPPYRGIIRHAGWRATRLGNGATILWPAELEVQ
jgi:hypothetical protein